MADKLAASVVLTTGGVASYGWLVTANHIGTLIVTLIAGIGAVIEALYHYERWKTYRKMNKENKE